MTEQFNATMDGAAIEVPPHAGFVRWYVEGARTGVFRAPRWNGLQTSPLLVAVMAAAGVLLTLMLERSYIKGAADFYWQAALNGWLGTAASAWICYLLHPRPDDTPDPVSGKDAAPTAMHLFCMLMTQSQVLSLVVGSIYAVLIRAGFYGWSGLGTWGTWAVWLVPMAWIIVAQWVLLWRGGMRRPGRVLIAALVLLGATALCFVNPMEFWYPARPQQAQAQRKRFELTQEAMEAQPRLLAQRLQEIAPQRPGVIDLYALTFAPYASQDVFRRESDMVAKVMAQRFDARGRTLQLVNHAETVEQWPWATPLNLQRAIRRFAQVMNPDEDILFLHLTSHGASDGELSATFWPMKVDAVTPDKLKRWLDEAHVKYRVISISACFSGSWIAPLADANTLVMTAADADHTSYGCGSRSELTYFGRAMYDEQLRTSTLSFEKAHAAAREIIRKREEEAGKTDGYSNPQIKEGEGIRARLALLQKQLQERARP